jgi:hypothetical protein
MKRLLFDVVLVLSIFILPWWVTLFLAIIGLFIFENFYEFFVSSIATHIISTVRSDYIFDKSFIVYLLIFSFYMLVQYIRRHIILYKNKSEGII